jgi:hypothetical protein
MSVTLNSAAWLLLVFTLPAKSATQRVQVWRKIQRYGMLPLRSSGYVLPNSAVNQERMEWLATAIRAYKGQASVIQVQAFDDLPPDRLKTLFAEARSRDYQKLLNEVRRYLATSPGRRLRGKLTRIRRRFLEIQGIDFFESPMRKKLEKLLAQTVEPENALQSARASKSKMREYANRVWITRPRPGIDRVSSAWLIRRFIDPKARFIFDSDPKAHPDAIPFDMFCASGFGHQAENCTFETLQKEFAIRDRRIKRIAEIVHDADFGDEKFGRVEGSGLEQVLNGWEKQDLSNDELLQRGMDLIEGLYESMT